MQKTRGFIMYVVLVIVAIVALGATQVKLPQLAENGAEKNQLEQAESAVQDYWHTYLEKPVLYIWNNLFSNFLWTVFLDNMKRASNGQMTDIQNWAPTFGNAEPTTSSSSQGGITVTTKKHTEIQSSDDIGS